MTDENAPSGFMDTDGDTHILRPSIIEHIYTRYSAVGDGAIGSTIVCKDKIYIDTTMTVNQLKALFFPELAEIGRLQDE